MERQQPTRVLVVDDDRTVRVVTQRMLERHGYEVVAAAGGREALDAFRAGDGGFGVVLLDLTMPEMDGAETFRQLRRLQSDVPVVIMTGHGEGDASKRLAPDAGTGFLQKPFSVAALTATISEAI